MSDKQTRIPVRILTRWALLTAAALILSWVESMLPFRIPVPGVKLGFSNVIVTYVLYEYSLPAALLFALLKVLTAAVFLGHLSGLPFALCGTLLSVCGMALLKKAPCFSALGVNCSGAVLHGAGQLVAASFLLSPSVLTLLPAMTVASAVCGAVTWIPLRAVGLCAQRLKQTEKPRKFEQ